MDGPRPFSPSRPAFRRLAHSAAQSQKLDVDENHLTANPYCEGGWHLLFALISREAVVSLIASTTTRTGLLVKAALDTNHYDTAIKVSDDELGHLKLNPHRFHGDWNYTINPRK